MSNYQGLKRSNTIQTHIQREFTFAENEMAAAMWVQIWGGDPKWHVEKGRAFTGWPKYVPFPWLRKWENRYWKCYSRYLRWKMNRY